MCLLFDGKNGPSFEQSSIPTLKNNLYQLWLKWHYGSGEEEFKDLSVYFPSPLLEQCVALHLNIFESLSPKDDLCNVWLKFGKWFWKEIQKMKSLQTDREIEKQIDTNWQTCRQTDWQTNRPGEDRQTYRQTDRQI
jgi:hypothetical protein